MLIATSFYVAQKTCRVRLAGDLAPWFSGLKIFPAWGAQSILLCHHRQSAIRPIVTSVLNVARFQSVRRCMRRSKELASRSLTASFAMEAAPADTCWGHRALFNL